MKHKRPLHCTPNHESLDFFRGFHLSELGMDAQYSNILHWTFFQFWSIVTVSVHPLFKWDLCSYRVIGGEHSLKLWHMEPCLVSFSYVRPHFLLNLVHCVYSVSAAAVLMYILSWHTHLHGVGQLLTYYISTLVYTTYLEVVLVLCTQFGQLTSCLTTWWLKKCAKCTCPGHFFHSFFFHFRGSKWAIF